MLHRAARNACSWWWANHIRTKQSKWLEQNLQDMEEKIEYTLNIINEDGDSFTMKADMFFQKRPELVNIIEDCLQGYRALAQRYDKLSKVMQNANRTIATVFPEKMELDMDDGLDDFSPVTSSSSEPERPPTSPPPPPVYISPKKSPSFSRKSFKRPTRMMSKRGLLKTGSMNDAAAAATKISGLSKSEALVEIDRLQKGILALQTEKEFVKSSYENGLAKCLNLDNEVTSMQAKVISLQDEFDIEKEIEDDEARMVMAATALNSCQEKLMTLQDKEEKSIKEAKAESKKVEKVRDKFETMIAQLTKQNSENKSVGETKKSENSDQKISIEEETNNLGMVKVSLKEQLQVNGDSSLTVTELAEKIDELVDTVLNLESTVSSQGALVGRLRLESNELQEKLESLEVDKETLTDSSDHKNNKIRDLENELHILQSFKQSVTSENKNTQYMLKDGSSSNDNPVDKVQNVESREPKREVPGVTNKNINSRNMFKDGSSSNDNSGNRVQNVESCEPTREVSGVTNQNKSSKNMFKDGSSSSDNSGDRIQNVESCGPKREVSGVTNENQNSQIMLKDGSSSNDNSGDKVQTVESCEPTREVSDVTNQNKNSQNMFNDGSSSNDNSGDIKHIGDSKADEVVQKDENRNSKFLAAEPELQSEQGNNHVDEHSMQELKMKGNKKKHGCLSVTNDSGAQEYGTVEEQPPNWKEIFSNDLEDREMLLLEEYTSLLRNFKQVKKKLSESEKKHRANLFKSTVQMKVLKSANASKDAEIQSLHKKLNLSQTKHDVPNTNKSTQGDSCQVPETSSPNLEQRKAYDILEGLVELSGSTGKSTGAAQDSKEYDHGGEVALESAISSIEEKIRMDLDELLEENIEFWIRYSASFHQVQKFQTTFEDLQAELSELNESKKQEGSTLQHSDVRPVYMHLREIQTELTLWLEQNVVLEDDLENRISSISSIQEEISRSSNAGSLVAADETELTNHQAAKFTGEVQNMKNENNKVANELLDGIERVKKLKVKIENAVAKLDEEFGFSAAKNQHKRHSKHKVPLRSFLFGVKLKKQKGSLLPSLQHKQQSDVCELSPSSSRS